MKPFVLLLAVLCACISIASAQEASYVVYKSTDGVVYLSKVPGLYFTLDIPGKTITPLSQPDSPNIYLMVDGRTFQVAIIALADFNGDASKPDAETLKRYVAYEKEYWSKQAVNFQVTPQKLSTGRDAAAWSFALSPELKAETLKNGGHPVSSNEMLSFRSGKFIVSLGSAVEAKFTKDEIRKFLLQIAATLHESDTPMALKFFPDGHYERQPAKDDARTGDTK